MSLSVPRERIVLYASLTTLTAVSIDALLPGLRDIAGELGAAPPLSTQHVVTLFIFGMVFGELFLSPISDAIGRRRAFVAWLGALYDGTMMVSAGSIFLAGVVSLLLGELSASGRDSPVVAVR